MSSPFDPHWQQNPFTQADPMRYPEQQYAQQQYPQGTYAQASCAPVPEPEGRSAVVVAAVIGIVVVVAALLAAGYFIFRPNNNGMEPMALSGPTNSTSTLNRAEPLEATASSIGRGPESDRTPAREAVTVTELATETVTQEARQTITRQSPQTASSNPVPAGLLSDGWEGNSYTRCDASETLIYAGTNGTDYVTVCSSGGFWTYRSLYKGGTLTRPVDKSNSQAEYAHFEVPADDNLIVIDGYGIGVYSSSGSLLSSRTFTRVYP